VCKSATSAGPRFHSASFAVQSAAERSAASSEPIPEARAEVLGGQGQKASFTRAVDETDSAGCQAAVGFGHDSFEPLLKAYACWWLRDARPAPDYGRVRCSG